ncbi:hypothetical protein ACS0TY_026706 [Phlomoides rotata]
MFLDSGIGLRNTSYMIDAPEDKWAVVIKKPMNKEGQCDSSTGIDQAPKTSHFNSGSHADFKSDLRVESSSGTKSTGKKRKLHDETDERFIEAINLFNENSVSRFSEMSFQMAVLLNMWVCI